MSKRPQPAFIIILLAIPAFAQIVPTNWDFENGVQDSWMTPK